MVDLSRLQSSLSKLDKFRHEERSFEVEGTKVVIRLLTAREEIEVNQAATDYFNRVAESETPQSDFLNGMELFKSYTLGYAIVQIGDLDLRNVSHVDTGETLENGVSVKVEKHVAIREFVLHNWTRFVCNEVYSHYGSLLEEVQKRYEREVQEGEDTPPAEAKESKPILPAVARPPSMQSPIPSQAPPPAREVTPSWEGAPPPAQDPLMQAPRVEPQPRPEPKPVQENQASRNVDPMTGIPLPYNGDSFMDDADPDKALEAEHRRQVELLRRAQERKAAKDPRLESLSQAAQTARVVSNDPPIRTRQAPPNIGGKQVYQLPAEVLTPQSDKTPEVVPINPSEAGSRNPRFTPRR